MYTCLLLFRFSSFRHDYFELNERKWVGSFSDINSVPCQHIPDEPLSSIQRQLWCHLGNSSISLEMLWYIRLESTKVNIRYNTLLGVHNSYSLAAIPCTRDFLLNYPDQWHPSGIFENLRVSGKPRRQSLGVQRGMRNIDWEGATGSSMNHLQNIFIRPELCNLKLIGAPI